MRATRAGRELIHAAEACVLEAYLDSGGVPSIGWGTTRYPPWHSDGRRVLLGDVCTQEQADLFFDYDLERTEEAVDVLTVDTVTPRQFDALVSFAYNVGEGSYRTSTLRKLVNANPNDPAIRHQFMRWHFDDGQPVRGLWFRRHREGDHYFGSLTPCPPFPYPRAA